MAPRHELDHPYRLAVSRDGLLDPFGSSHRSLRQANRSLSHFGEVDLIAALGHVR